MKRHTADTLNSSCDVVMPTHTTSIELIQSPEEVTQLRHQAIQEAAYWRASERGFAAGGEIDDWLGAEANVDGVRSDNVIE